MSASCTMLSHKANTSAIRLEPIRALHQNKENSMQLLFRKNGQRITHQLTNVSKLLLPNI